MTFKVKQIKEKFDPIWKIVKFTIPQHHCKNAMNSDSKELFMSHYSHNITSSDVILFGYMKEKLKGCIFMSIMVLEEEIYSILEEILRAKKIEVFKIYIRSYKCISEHNNAYFKAD